jgi:hypothetical protein
MVFHPFGPPVFFPERICADGLGRKTPEPFTKKLNFTADAGPGMVQGIAPAFKTVFQFVI